MHLFFEVHQGLPREAPGDEESTLRALALMKDLPPAPSILDIGCGPGAQTITLARHSAAQITAVDVHQPFLDELACRAANACVSERIKTVNASMSELEFEESFDAIWSEGAIYIIGFAEGLRAWRPLLKPDGYLAVTELSWIKPDPPEEALKYWQADYPGMVSVDENLSRARAAGYRDLEHFVLPERSWWEPYYHPMEARVAQLRRKYYDDPEAQRLLDVKDLEVEMYRKFSAWYGYVFYVMKG
jgi:ubiquinone/menaquinone biosynthesis C-methylase UbiE